MERKLLKIGKVYKRLCVNKIMLCAEIQLDDKVKEGFFRFDAKYEKYVCFERADAFLLCLFYYAVINDFDMQFDTPISERLLYQLKFDYMPMLANTTDFFHIINIYAKTTAEKMENNGKVVTAMSSGVDSMYTTLKYLHTEFESYRLTHLIFTDIPASVFSEELRETWMAENLTKFNKVADEFGLETIIAETNINKEFRIRSFVSPRGTLVSNEGISALQYCSFAFALAKLIHIYYLSSAGYALPDVKVNNNPYDVLWHDFISMPCISTDNLLFYSKGIEVDRIQKISYIADDEVVKRNLLACCLPITNNCGRCEKCVRTMGELYAIGKLHNFKQVFPVEEFEKHLTKHIAMILANSKKPYYRDILKVCKENKRRLPGGAYILCYYYKIVERLRLKFHNVSIFRKIYYALDLDKKRYGVSTKGIRTHDFLAAGKNEL